MRFLDTTTLEFVEVADSELHLAENKYAILSHRWGADGDEVTYEDVASQLDYSSKKGYIKLTGFCKLAHSLGYQHGWIDTCCIVKSNSSELTEAINSMYLWYRESSICIVFLHDVVEENLTDSQWFDRGWTLQELVAPNAVSFFDHEWNSLGTKLDLLQRLSEKTAIPCDVLSNSVEPSACSVAQRMSWAARRTTKRIEDRAYSLLGLFDVHMPMIYGERENAFTRLQQQIVQKSKDESLFAWSMGSPNDETRTYSSIYAPSPCEFATCGRLVPTSGSNGFSEANGELSIQLSVENHHPGTLLAYLNCCDTIHPLERECIVIAAIPGQSTFVRVRDARERSRLLGDVKAPNSHTQNLRFPISPASPPTRIIWGYWIRTLQPPGYAESDICTLSCAPTTKNDFVCQTSNYDPFTGIVQFRPKNTSISLPWSQVRWIQFGFNKDHHPILWIANDTQTARVRDTFERLLAFPRSADSSSHRDELKKMTLGGKDDKLFTDQDLYYKWPHGRAVVDIDPKTGLDNFVIHSLNIKVSVHLRPNYDPVQALSRATVSGGLLQSPTMVWVVDITTVVTRPESLISVGDVSWCSHVCFSCTFCLPCLLWHTFKRLKPNRAVEVDFLSPWCVGRDKKVLVKTSQLAYERNVSNRVPLLGPALSRSTRKVHMKIDFGNRYS